MTTMDLVIVAIVVELGIIGLQLITLQYIKKNLVD